MNVNNDSIIAKNVSLNERQTGFPLRLMYMFYHRQKIKVDMTEIPCQLNVDFYFYIMQQCKQIDRNDLFDLWRW